MTLDQMTMPTTYTVSSSTASMPTGLNALSTSKPITVSTEIFEKAKNGTLTLEEINSLMGQPSTTMADDMPTVSTQPGTPPATDLATQSTADPAMETTKVEKATPKKKTKSNN